MEARATPLATAQTTDLVPAMTSAFRARRTQNWLIVGLLYASFYMTRYNLSALSAQIADLVGWDNKAIGVFGSILALVYGISVFVNGPLADRIGGKRAFLIGAAGVFVTNIAFGLALSIVMAPAVVLVEPVTKVKFLLADPSLAYGFTPSSFLALMVTIWGVNGYFQSFGALAIVKVNAQWFHVFERGRFAAVFGVLIRFGLILANSVVPLLAGLGLRWGFLIPAACVALLFVLVYFFVENTPVDAGLPPFDAGDGAGADDGKPARLGAVLKQVFSNPTAWVIALASMMIGFVRRSVIDDWWPKYMINTFNVQKDQMATYGPRQLAAWGIALVGIAGGFAFGHASDKVYGARRAPVIMYGFIGMAFFLGAIGLAHRYALNPWTIAALLSALSFFVNGAHGMIGGAASMDFGGRKAAATAAGLFDGMQYLAGAVVGIGVGAIVDAKGFGWAYWPLAPIPFAIAGAAIIATIWNAKPKTSGGH